MILLIRSFRAVRGSPETILLIRSGEVHVGDVGVGERRGIFGFRRGIFGFRRGIFGFSKGIFGFCRGTFGCRRGIFGCRRDDFVNLFALGPADIGPY